MLHYQGVCLASPAWWFLNLGVDSRCHDLDLQTWDQSDPALQDLAETFAIALTPADPASPAFATRHDGLIEPVIKSRFATSWRRPCDNILRNWASPEAIGICHGLLPRAIRRVLPQWFERRERGVSPGVYPVSVPVAAYMGWIMSGRSRVPDRCLILSGTDRVLELMIVTASQVDESLHMTIHAACELRSNEPISEQRQRIVGLFRKTSAIRQGSWMLAKIGESPVMQALQDQLTDMAREQQVRLSAEIETADSTLLVRGAAGYAAFKRTQRIPGSTITSFDYTESFARDIGLIGDNGRGDHFWHRVFTAGQTLPASSSELRLRGSCPATVQLLEYLGDDEAPVWQTIDDPFLKQLRWYGVAAVTIPRDVQPRRLTIRITAATADTVPQLQAEGRAD